MNTLEAKNRICTTCKVEKVITDFNIAVRPYRRFVCNKCEYKQKKAYFMNYRKVHKEKWKAIHEKGQKKYTQNNPLKIKAHQLAKKLKDIIKKDACEKCGAKGKLHMHHPDYSRPDYILTLCIKHHEEIHHG